MRIPGSIYAAAVALIASGAAAGCGGRSGAEQKPPPGVPVDVYRVDTGRASYYNEYPATVSALEQVDLRPEVSGYLTGIYFRDGQHVRKGERLYAIDQQHYQAAYDQATANLAVARANLSKTQQDVDRYTTLAKNDAIARQTLDHAVADLESARSQVVALEANQKSVATDLRYSVIYAPFDCTIGISLVKVGSAVVAGQTLLNTVSSDDPMAVDCAVDEKLISRFAMMLGSKDAQHDSTFTIVLPDGSAYPSPGRLSLLDRAVDPQTGTLRIRVVFPNPRGVLKPGLTCDLRVRNESRANTVLFPFRAAVEQMGEYSVFVLNGDRVTQRRVELGPRINDMVVARSGLAPGDQIVVEGVQKLRDNATVTVTPPKTKTVADASPVQ
ncbi:MAG TPA: efflux RND transporter periplasmic adaptor subunit [Bacteroidota bacterium]|nr:efflux RND transporter periplasmic adaptor subunit [Bacteroidota bacterium]